MLSKDAIAWAITVGSRVFRREPDRLRSSWRIAEEPVLRPQVWRGKLDAVTMEVGSGEAMILVAVYSDGRTRLGFGTGEEFVGSCQDLPLKVGAAVRDVLEAATPLVRHLPRRGPEIPRGGGSVRITVHGTRAVHSAESRIADLDDGHSVLAPLWDSFSDLLTAMIVTLFGPRAVHGATHEIPGLARARRLWGTDST